MALTCTRFLYIHIEGGFTDLISGLALDVIVARIHFVKLNMCVGTLE